MNKKYKPCIIALLAAFAVIFVLDKANIQFQSLLANAIGVTMFVLPLEILFILMSKDEKFSPQNRMLFKIIYIAILFSYVGGLAACILTNS